MSNFSAAEARRIALDAQGFGSTARGRVTAQRMVDTIERLRVLQIDSVNVFERSHYLPLFSRLGTYDTGVLDSVLLDPSTPATHVEYWAHEAAFIPIESWPLWRWKMRAAAEKHAKPGAWLAENRKLADSLLDRLRNDGPATFSQLEDSRNRKRGTWWDWSDAKLALEYLFYDGVVTTQGRTNFQRVYAAVDDVIPADIRAIEIPENEARRTLVAEAVRALGIGTAKDIADYFRFKNAPALTAIHDLVDEGSIERVTVQGWEHRGKPIDAFVVAGTDAPARKPTVSTILTPFDPITWNRERASRMFGFDYRIEIYTPAPKRIYGYYSLPILMGDSLVGRIDLKADRKTKTLIVKSAHWEARKPADAVDRLAEIVRRAAAWRGLNTVVVESWGDAADDLLRVL